MQQFEREGLVNMHNGNIQETGVNVSLSLEEREQQEAIILIEQLQAYSRLADNFGRRLPHVEVEKQANISEAEKVISERAETFYRAGLIREETLVVTEKANALARGMEMLHKTDSKLYKELTKFIKIALTKVFYLDGLFIKAEAALNGGRLALMPLFDAEDATGNKNRYMYVVDQPTREEYLDLWTCVNNALANKEILKMEKQGIEIDSETALNQAVKRIDSNLTQDYFMAQVESSGTSSFQNWLADRAEPMAQGIAAQYPRATIESWAAHAKTEFSRNHGIYFLLLLVVMSLAVAMALNTNTAKAQGPEENPTVEIDEDEDGNINFPQLMADTIALLKDLNNPEARDQVISDLEHILISDLHISIGLEDLERAETAAEWAMDQLQEGRNLLRTIERWWDLEMANAIYDSSDANLARQRNPSFPGEGLIDVGGHKGGEDERTVGPTETEGDTEIERASRIEAVLLKERVRREQIKNISAQISVENGNRASLRVGPSTDAFRITLLDNETPITVVGISTDGEWVEVLTEGNNGELIGWVSIGLTSLVDENGTVSSEVDELEILDNSPMDEERTNDRTIPARIIGTEDFLVNFRPIADQEDGLVGVLTGGTEGNIVAVGFDQNGDRWFYFQVLDPDSEFNGMFGWVKEFHNDPNNRLIELSEGIPIPGQDAAEGGNVRSLPVISGNIVFVDQNGQPIPATPSSQNIPPTSTPVPSEVASIFVPTPTPGNSTETSGGDGGEGGNGDGIPSAATPEPGTPTPQAVAEALPASNENVEAAIADLPVSNEVKDSLRAMIESGEATFNAELGLIQRTSDGAFFLGNMDTGLENGWVLRQLPEGLVSGEANLIMETRFFVQDGSVVQSLTTDVTPEQIDMLNTIISDLETELQTENVTMLDKPLNVVLFTQVSDTGTMQEIDVIGTGRTRVGIELGENENTLFIFIPEAAFLDPTTTDFAEMDFAYYYVGGLRLLAESLNPTSNVTSNSSAMKDLNGLKGPVRDRGFVRPLFVPNDQPDPFIDVVLR